jgi:dihydroorotate dehydrogenase (NAD+) catalytic subunit
MAIDLSTTLAEGGKYGGLTLANPVMPASGTFSYGLEFAREFDVNRLGAVVAKSVSLRPRKGNPQPRVAETPMGMLNSIGLQNVGLEKLLREYCPVWETWKTPVIANLVGETPGEFAELAARLDGAPGIAAFELNISCPNVEQGGMEMGQDPRVAAAITAAVRRETGLPLLVKLTPNVTSIQTVARAVEEAGADALTVINTVQGMAIDVRKRRPRIARVFGGLSGPAIKPVALRMVYQVYRAVQIPIVGCGGIRSGEDALEFIMAGASAVQVGTATFWNPRACLDVLEQLEALMVEEGIASVKEVIGAAQAE